MASQKSQITQHVNRLGAYLALACKERFRGSHLGFVWSVVHPAVPLAVQNLVFAHFLDRDPLEYFFFISAGFIPWFFLSQSIQASNRGLLQHAGVLKTRPQALPPLFTAEVLTGLLPLLFWFPVLWLMDLAMPLAFTLAVISFLVGTIALCFLLSWIQIFFRDTRFLLPLLLQCGLFLTPILYPIEQWPLARWVEHPAWINPLFVLIEPIQGILTGEGPRNLGASIFFSASLCLGANWLWKHRRQGVVLNA